MILLFQQNIPIKKYCSDLKHDEHIKTLQFQWGMSALQVKNVIQRGFSHIKSSSFLESLSSTLRIAHDESLDGAAVIDQRGALYLCGVSGL